MPRKNPNAMRHGGPGSSHENAKMPPSGRGRDTDDHGERSRVSGGGGEADLHHSHDPHLK